MRPALPRNDLRLYDVLVDEWWRSSLAFAGLRWIAAARAALMPPAVRSGAVLVDLGCGGGLLAPHVARLGYRHVGVDRSRSALEVAARHGVIAVQADAAAVPLADGCADVVGAGGVCGRVPTPSTVVSEACRLLRPGGTLVVDTVNATALARFLVVTLGERVTRLAPRGLHDPRLFVRPELVCTVSQKHGVALAVRGVRPAVGDLLRWLVNRRRDVRLVPTFTKGVLYLA